MEKKTNTKNYPKLKFYSNNQKDNINSIQEILRSHIQNSFDPNVDLCNKKSETKINLNFK